MADQIRFIPSIRCAKCGNEAVTDVRRVHEQKTNKRYLVARHHGEQVIVPFAAEPGAEVKVFDAAA